MKFKPTMYKKNIYENGYKIGRTPKIKIRMNYQSSINEKYNKKE